MDRISQEFYCGECQGYFVVRLNIAQTTRPKLCVQTADTSIVVVLSMVKSSRMVGTGQIHGNVF